LNQIQEAFAQLLTKDFAKMFAKFMKQYYDALIAEGFTPEQAIELCSQANFKS
jgi:hypothetical protein